MDSVIKIPTAIELFLSFFFKMYLFSSIHYEKLLYNWMKYTHI